MNRNIRIVTTKTPLRITFTGGGTDIPDFYRNYGPGSVVSASINKYIYVTVASNFRTDEIRVSYSKTENAIKNIDDIKHPTVREALRLLDIKKGLQIVSITEVPSEGTGLGSSSSFLVGLLNALHTWIGETVSPGQLAQEAVKIEREILKEPEGKQDQYLAAYGGIQHLIFESNEEVKINRIKMDEEGINALNQMLMLFYTGIERKSSIIHNEQKKNVENKKSNYERMRDIAFESAQSILRMDFENLGKLMDENWKLKRELGSGITMEDIDRWYSDAINAGAYGGKLIGAGGGGFLLFLSPPENRTKVIKSLNQLKIYEIHIENFGSRIVYME
ncbi:GHMP family kinase ATP-binding protein [Caldiplasma sukawensis]